MKDKFKIKGFTLIELMVSVSLTAILMLGIATFFSGTFQNMFLAREKVANTQGQFVVNTIIGGKFVNVDQLEYDGGTYAVLRNDMNTGDLPFTYIATDTLSSTGHVVFKDFFVFNGKEGPDSSYGLAVDNPGGITILPGNNFYLTAPLENDIYLCNPTIGCSPMGIVGLDQPIDVTSNGTDTLYVTNAGKNEIIKIENLGTTKDVTPILTGLNYPTGIAYYKPGATAYLFVSDTYNHFVKKVDIGAQTAEVVVGEGDSADCDGTALYCKLSFPTGLMIENNELYIADTGSGRVLKVSDPGHPEDFTFDFLSPEAEETIKEIKLVFPAGTDHSGTTLDSVTSSSLDEHGDIDQSAETFTYKLWTTLDQDTSVTNDQPFPTPDTMNIIRVVNGDLFEADDSLILSNDANNEFEVDSKLTTFRMSLKTDFATHHFLGEEVILSTPVPAETGITFELSAVDTTGVSSSGFNIIDIEMYDEGGALLETRQSYVRIGDDELGTPEDVIEDTGGAYDFPTGLGWSGGLQVSIEPLYDTATFPNYDYVSEFEVDSFGFSTLNSYEILELNFNAELGEDSESNPIWEDYTLNADI